MSLLTALRYGTDLGSQQTAMLAAQDAGMGASSMSGIGSAFSTMGPWLAVAGAVQGAIGNYYQAKTQQAQIQSQAKSQQFQLESQKLNLDFQKSLSQINARQAEFQAQNILLAGERQIGQLTMKAGQVKGATRAALAARGGVLSEGSNVEVMGSQDIVKEIDTLTINANAVRAAEAARTQGVNYMNQATMQGVSAQNYGVSASMLGRSAEASLSSINPFMSAATSLLGGATALASTYYRDRRLDAIASRLGVSQG